MSNNIVWLQGFFEIDCIETMPLGKEQFPVIHAWVHTDQEWEGGKHPLLISGKPAQIVLEMSQGSSTTPEVLINGRLLSRGNRSWVDVKRITFLGIPMGIHGMNGNNGRNLHEYQR